MQTDVRTSKIGVREMMLLTLILSCCLAVYYISMTNSIYASLIRDRWPLNEVENIDAKDSHMEAPVSNALYNYRKQVLESVARDIGLASSAAFAHFCYPYTPINLCAEFARMSKAGSIGCASDICTVPAYRESESKVLSEDLVGNVVRNGLGLEVIPASGGRVTLRENGVFLTKATDNSQSSAQEISPSSNSSTSATMALNQKDSIGTASADSDIEPFVPYSHKEFFEGLTHDPVVPKDRKVILWYTSPRYTPTMPGLTPLKACPEFPCVVTTNRRYTDSSAALLFNSAENVPVTPIKRRKDQIFVYHNQEPPSHHDHSVFNAFQQPAWRGAFNWTMTYRHDSDIVSPYGIVRRRRGRKIDDAEAEGDPSKDYVAILGGKTKLVGAMISNCGSWSRRDEYIRELSRHVDVDVYGACGNFTCPRGEDSKCLDMIGRNYKFWLSFENSMCEDYITEKFFRFLNGNLIPVVRGSNEYFTHAPKEIFVNTADFKSPYELAQRLRYLDSHHEEYLKMLKAKDEYVAIFEDWPILDEGGRPKFHHYHYEAVPFCQMCQRLWNLDKYAKTIPDIKTWFDEKLCKTDKEIRDISVQNNNINVKR